jgi:hypothetical protein
MCEVLRPTLPATWPIATLLWLWAPWREQSRDDGSDPSRDPG